MPAWPKFSIATCLQICLAPAWQSVKLSPTCRLIADHLSLFLSPAGCERRVGFHLLKFVTVTVIKTLTVTVWPGLCRPDLQSGFTHAQGQCKGTETYNQYALEIEFHTKPQFAPNHYALETELLKNHSLC